MLMIDSYIFGRLDLGGETFSKDIIIFPDGTVLSPWWRKSGHRLEAADMQTLLSTKPDIIVAGTGASGLMHPSDELHELLEKKNIEFIALPTGKAIHVFNEQVHQKRTGGCFHLTC